ncbi:hypothetical protein AB0K89_10155 [Streptomyces cinnamoneus]|uniref:hypothetical protein n=1 Tax=Streptomyces cinnamoneus TaxID=53446 RepID=UPI003445BA03
MLAEQLKASDVGLEFLTGELKGSHDPSGIVKRLVIATGATKGRRPSPVTVMRMLREHDAQTATTATTASS